MARGKKLEPAVLQDVRILLRNFTGTERKYNPPGKRNFAIALDPDVAAAMERDGWAIKAFKLREDEDIPQRFIKVNVEFDKGTPPRISMITSRGRTPLTKDMVEMLDVADIVSADVELNPYQYDVIDGKPVYTAYLRKMYVTIREDELDLKYAELDEVGPGRRRDPQDVPF